MTEEKKRPHLRIVRSEDEDRRADNPPATGEVNGPPVKRSGDARNARAIESGVESMADGEAEAAKEAAKARDD